MDWRRQHFCGLHNLESEKNMKRIAIMLALLWIPLSSLGQSFTAITASGIFVDNGSGGAIHPPSGSSLCFLGVNNLGATITYTPLGGSPTSGNVCQTLNSSGALTGSLQVANGATASPSGLFYTITVFNGSTTYLTIPVTQVQGALFSIDSFSLSGSKAATGIGFPHLACNIGAQWASTTLPQPQAASVCELVSGSTAWQGYPQQPFCPAGTSFQNPLVPALGGTPFCLPPIISNIGAPTGTCINKSIYFETNSPGTIYGCVSAIWVLISSSGASGLTSFNGRTTPAATLQSSDIQNVLSGSPFGMSGSRNLVFDSGSGTVAPNPYWNIDSGNTLRGTRFFALSNGTTDVIGLNEVTGAATFALGNFTVGSSGQLAWGGGSTITSSSLICLSSGANCPSSTTPFYQEWQNDGVPLTPRGNINLNIASGIIATDDPSNNATDLQLQSIPNSAIANPGVTINTTGGATGGGFVQLGGSLTIDVSGAAGASSPPANSVQIAGSVAGSFSSDAAISVNASTHTLTSENVTSPFTEGPLTGTSGFQHSPEFVNVVTDCGVPSDHITDATTAINACIAQFAGGTTRAFFFPRTNNSITAGQYDYVISGTITIAKTVYEPTLYGETQGENLGIRILQTTDNTGLLINTTGATVRNITFYGSTPWTTTNLSTYVMSGTSDGIRVCGPATTLDHVGAYWFSRHGFNLDSNACIGGSTDFGSSNVSQLLDLYTVQNRGNGINLSGSDANVITVRGGVMTQNQLFGFQDRAAYPATVIGLETDSNHNDANSPVNPITVTSASVASGLMTVNCASACGIANNDVVNLAGFSNSLFNGKYEYNPAISSGTSATSFTILSGDKGPADGQTSTGGTVSYLPGARIWATANYYGGCCYGSLSGRAAWIQIYAEGNQPGPMVNGQVAIIAGGGIAGNTAFYYDGTASFANTDAGAFSGQGTQLMGSTGDVTVNLFQVRNLNPSTNRAMGTIFRPAQGTNGGGGIDAAWSAQAGWANGGTGGTTAEMVELQRSTTLANTNGYWALIDADNAPMSTAFTFFRLYDQTATTFAPGTVEFPNANPPVFDSSLFLPYTGSTQCLEVNTAGLVVPTGSVCGGGGGGSGTVVSVGISAPSWLAVGGSPVTTSGTLALTAATGQTSHEVIGTCGTATSFGPCALTGADLPLATVSLFGAVKPDGTTITISGGVISAVGGGGSVATIGVTTANGVSGTSSGGANPLLTIALGAITPSSISLNGSQVVNGLQGSTGTKLMAASGSFSSGNLLSSDGSGNAINSGVSATNLVLLNATQTFTAPNTFSVSVTSPIINARSESGAIFFAGGQITTTNPKQINFSNSPSTNTLTIQTVHQGISFTDQTLAINPQGGPITFGGVVEPESESGGILFAAGQITTANPKQLEIINSPSTNTLTIQTIHQGIGFDQNLAINPSGGPVSIGDVLAVNKGNVTSANVFSGMVAALGSGNIVSTIIGVNGSTNNNAFLGFQYFSSGSSSNVAMLAVGGGSVTTFNGAGNWTIPGASTTIGGQLVCVASGTNCPSLPANLAFLNVAQTFTALQTFSSGLSASTGTFGGSVAINNSGSGSVTSLSAMAASLGSGNLISNAVGVNSSTNNYALFGFQYVSSGSSSNVGVIALGGGSATTFNSSGAWAFPSASTTVAGQLICEANGTNCPSGLSGTDYYWTEIVSGCTLGTSTGDTCGGNIHLPGAMPNSSYQVICSAFSATAQNLTGMVDGITLPTASGGAISVTAFQNLGVGGSGSGSPTFMCHAHHN